MKIKATFISERIESNSKEAHDLFSTQLMGKKSGEKIIYSLAEAFYILEKGDMEILDSRKKNLTSNDLIKKFHKLDENFGIKFLVFKDLRKKGYIVKSALKFGADYRVYERGVRNLKDHSKWIVYVVKDSSKINWADFASKNRVAHSVSKKLLIAVVDSEEDISYFESSWTKT